MSKRKKNPTWDEYKEKMSNKRTGKHDEGSCSGIVDYITVQRLSSTVEGKCQKYSHIGALTIIPLGSTLSNIKTASKNHFNLPEIECDLLAGESWPSYTDISMITNWKVLHIRFIPKSNEVCDPSNSRAREETRSRASASPVKSEQVRPRLALPAPSKIPASVPLSAMLQIQAV